MNECRTREKEKEETSTNEENHLKWKRQNFSAKQTKTIDI